MASTPYNQERREVKNSKENTEEGLHLSIRWQGSEATTTRRNAIDIYLVQSQAVDYNCRICFPFDKMYDDIGYAATT